MSYSFRFRHAVCLGFSLGSVLATTNSSGSDCCSRLTAVLGVKVSFPESPTYLASLSSYWNQVEQDIDPACILTATTAEDVSVALSKVLVPQSCQFAVRSGGHGSAPGTANIAGGVTIDLSQLNTTFLSEDRSTVSVGSGVKVGVLYSYLGKYGLSAASARDYSVGVAGSTLGGGLGFLYPFTGFACDGVLQYEVVLASGQIVVATANNYADLFYALHGGMGNFGVITNFVLKTYPLGNIWAGDAEYYGDVISNEAQAIYNFVSNPDYNPKAAIMVTYHYSAGSDPVIVTEYTYAEPNISDTNVFDELIAVPNQLLNNTGTTTLTEFSISADETSPYGYQQITFDLSFTNNVEMLIETWNIFNATLASIASINGVSWSVTLEPMLEFITAGPNIFGVEVPSEGLIIAIMSVTFTDPSDYAYMLDTSQRFLAQLTSAAEGLGVFNRWIEPNHAGSFQSVLASYGPERSLFLNETAQKYDPNAVFQILKPGGQKL